MKITIVFKEATNTITSKVIRKNIVFDSLFGLLAQWQSNALVRCRSWVQFP